MYKTTPTVETTKVETNPFYEVIEKAGLLLRVLATAAAFDDRQEVANHLLDDAQLIAMELVDDLADPYEEDEE